MKCENCDNFSNQDKCPADCDPELIGTTEMNNDRWCPDVCSITFRPFFMWIDHPELGLVPTYGGPFDSYTIPTPDLPESKKVKLCDVEYTTFRFDHDAGSWIDEEEDSGLRVIAETHLLELEDRIEKYGEIIRTSNQIIHDKVVVEQCALIEFSVGDHEAAERWIYNDLAGPGFIPDVDDQYHDNAQHWWGANNAAPLKKCACGNPSHIICDNVTACSNLCWSKNKMMRDLKNMN